MQEELLEAVLESGARDMSEINFRALSERFRFPANTLRQRVWRQISLIPDNEFRPLHGKVKVCGRRGRAMLTFFFLRY